MKCKICGAVLKPGARECEFCGNSDFIPEMLPEADVKPVKTAETYFKRPNNVRDLTGNETVIVHNTAPTRRKFCKRCGRELNPNGKCRICDNDRPPPVTPQITERDEELSSRRNKKKENRIPPAVVVLLCLIGIAVLFAVASLYGFKWINSEQEDEPKSTSETVETAVDTPTETAKAQDWQPEGTLAPVTTPQTAPTPTPTKGAASPAPAKPVDPAEQKGGVYKYDTHKKVITEAELDKMQRLDIKTIYNEIYARHGMIFTDKTLKTYFESQVWYEGKTSDESAIEAQFNANEKENKRIIFEYQKKKGWR